MKIKLNNHEVKLSGGRLKIYNLLKQGYKLKWDVNFILLDSNNVFQKVIHGNQDWTISLMKMDKILVFSPPHFYVINPEIQEI